MKKVITYCIIVLLGSLLTSCFWDFNPPKHRSFVRGYYDVDDIDVSVQPWDNDNDIWIEGTKEGDRWDVCNSGIQKEKYDALCEKHNDMSWNGGSITGMYILGVDFLSISVVSDAAFDETHPAGASLADVLEFRSESIYPFLKNGYDLDSSNTDGFYTITMKPLSQITPDELVMLGGNVASTGSAPDKTVIAALFWLCEPTLSQVHNITVTMTADDGRVFEKTVQVSWE